MIYFISDLHLDSEGQPNGILFDRFLKKHAPHAKKIYILGDFFELWIGDDQSSTFIESIKMALRQLNQQGIQVFLMHGNRDFLLGSTFIEETGCQWLPDPVVIQLEDQSVLLSHGDLLCTEDHAYQQYRRFVHHPWIKKIFLSFPLKLRRWIAGKLRKQSGHSDTESHKRHTTSKKYKSKTVDVTPSAVENWMLKHGSRILIHGHTHQPAVHGFELEGQPAKRIVLGDWHDSAQIARYFNQSLELIEID